MKIEGWDVIDEEAGVLVREYAFTKHARATSLVFRGTDGLVVISPPRGLETRELDSLRELGEVRALVANNAYHHLGQAAWRARFPDAVSYAPAGTIPRLTKQTKGIPFRSLDELVLPTSVRCEVPPGYKQGETIARIETRKGSVWYAGDLFANMQRLPPPPVKWLFSATDSAPGFKLFRPAVWLLMKNAKQVRDWALARMDETPPSIVVPAHGPAFDVGDVAARAREQLRKL
jgi:hypothetical protein